MSGWTVRAEAPSDIAAIAQVTAAAFATAQHSDGNEAEVIDRLRADGDLALSLVAVAGGIVGHVAFSPVQISDGSRTWYGLGPVSVTPEFQRRGAGAALVRAGLALLRERSARGCVVLGNPDYYARFGFVHDPVLAYPGPPARFFQRLVLHGAPPSGVVTYAPGFG